MAFNPKILNSSAKAGGFSLDNAVSEIQSQNSIQQAANIDINGTLSVYKALAQVYKWCSAKTCR